MGRKPDPAATQDAKGNPGKRLSRKERAEASAAQGVLDVVAGEAAPPAFLKAPKLRAALGIWRELAPSLKRYNALDRLDTYSFAMLCVHLADWIQATKDIAKNGTWRLVKTVSGDEMPRLNPAVKVREIAEKHIEVLTANFGMNPAARYKLMRDQAATPLGGLFGRSDPDPKPAGAPGPGPETSIPSPIGLLPSLGGSRPN